MNTVSTNEDKLIPMLAGNETQLLLDFVNVHGSINAITAIENFIIGFRLGVRIGIEVMDDEDGVLRDIS